jgi:hypothetical protein
VSATLVYQGIRLADTALVNITAEASPPAFRHLKFQLADRDSARIAIPNLHSLVYASPNSKTLLAEAQDSTEQRIGNSLVAVQTSDPLQALIGDGTSACDAAGTVICVSDRSSVRAFIQTSGRAGDSVTIRASATVYGVTLQDSVRLYLTPQLLFVYAVRAASAGGTPAFTLLPNAQEAIGVGGYVWWNNQTADSLDVVFDDPTAAAPDQALGFLFADMGMGGNVLPFPGNPDLTAPGFSSIVSRQFLRAGRFPWHSTRMGVSGTVVVQ